MNRYRDAEIQFSGLKSGSYDYHFTLEKAFFECFETEILTDGRVDFEVKLEKSERMLMFHFTFSGQVQTQCDRCLGELDVPVSGSQTLCVKFSDTETSEDVDVVFLPEGAYQIDLAQWMYEYVAVSMPMQHVHPEGQCDEEMLQYITEAHEEDDETEVRELGEGETDPRWAALKNLLDK